MRTIDPEASTDAARDASTTRVVDSSIALLRVFAAVKAAQGGSARHLLSVIRADGPLRQSALAGSLHADPSTISRHVAELVADRLVERTPDPADGRASLLGLTAHGTEHVIAMRARRDARVADAMSAWTTEDIDRFAQGLQRYADDLRSLVDG